MSSRRIGQERQPKIAYLTSQYPATSHTFIRREVEALRNAGLPIETFSVRAPAPDELKSSIDQHEAQATYTLLDQSVGTVLTSHLREFVTRPGRYLSNLGMAFRHRAPGLRNALLSLAHFGEAMLLSDELRRRGITRLHNHFANSAATVGLLAARQAGVKWSFTIHGVSEFDYPAGLTLAEKIAAADFVACVSYFGRAQAERLTEPALWSKLTIVRCGLALDRLPAPSRSQDGYLRIVAVGRLSPEKGFSGLLKAFAKVAAGVRARLILVGDGPLGPALREEARELRLADRVEFLGRLPEEETLAVIAASDVLVLSSFMEGLPIVLMEALALGKPVVATRVAGVPELVREGETGLLFVPSDWEGLASALDRVIGDPAERAAMGDRGPGIIAAEFDVALSAKRLCELFLETSPSDSTPLASPA